MQQHKRERGDQEQAVSLGLQQERDAALAALEKGMALNSWHADARNAPL